MAELLVRAKPHWKDSFTQKEVDKLSEGELQSYKARSQIGDIIVVKPDGWKWGKEECLPNFIVIKVPYLEYKDAKKYEESLVDETDPEKPTLLKHRKHQIPLTVVENAKQLLQTDVSISKLQKDTFISNIIVKDK